jgi:tRNA modification GTPase
MDWPELLERLGSIRADFERLVEGYKYGRIVREGLSLAIVGRPNVGKSSLFNRLLNEDRAIVTATPGTTRDLVAESASIGGIPLRFVDTAGVRETTDEAERIGVQKTLEAIADSDLRLLTLDASEPWAEEDTNLLRRVRPLGPLLVAANKSDLPSRLSLADVERRLALEADGATPAGVVQTSALTGDGLAQLKEKILELATPAHHPGDEFITNLRHRQLLEECVEALARARQAAIERAPHEMLLLDLYDALRSIDTITGATYVDDLLGIIFSKFCIGK